LRVCIIVIYICFVCHKIMSHAAQLKVMINNYTALLVLLMIQDVHKYVNMFMLMFVCI